MKFTVNRSSLLRELTFLQSVTEKKTTIPILQNIKFSAAHKVGGINLAGTDLDLFLDTSVDGTVIETGSCCIPAKKLTEIVKALPESEISFEVKDQIVRITCERSKFKLTGFDPDSFPQAKIQPDTMLPFPADTLATLISRVRFAASQEESRYTLNCVKFEYKDGNARAVCTDSHRLALCARSAYYEGGDIDTLIPLKTADMVVKLAETQEPALFAVADNQMFFTFGKRSLTSRTLAGQYPAYQRIVEDIENKTTPAIADGGRMASLLKRIALVTDDKSKACKVTFTPGQMTANAATAEVGEGAGDMDVESAFDDLTIGMNIGYMAEYFSVIPDGNVSIGIKDTQSAILMKPIDDGDYDFTYIIMPMRV